MGLGLEKRTESMFIFYDTLIIGFIRARASKNQITKHHEKRHPGAFLLFFGLIYTISRGI